MPVWRLESALPALSAFSPFFFDNPDNFRCFFAVLFDFFVDTIDRSRVALNLVGQVAFSAGHRFAFIYIVLRFF